jgi:hypothetical protein
VEVTRMKPSEVFFFRFRFSGAPDLSPPAHLFLTDFSSSRCADTIRVHFV